jgi:predicted TPR repeat methyltransferase
MCSSFLAFVAFSNGKPDSTFPENALAPVGLFAFSVETHQADGVVLGEKLRYAHGAAHVRAALADAGLKLQSIEECSTRTEAAIPVAGLITVAIGVL